MQYALHLGGEWLGAPLVFHPKAGGLVQPIGDQPHLDRLRLRAGGEAAVLLRGLKGELQLIS